MNENRIVDSVEALEAKLREIRKAQTKFGRQHSGKWRLSYCNASLYKRLCGRAFKGNAHAHSH